ncbi:pyrroline-5-carboxylate reductase [Algoriphagus namhaensis]
MNQTIAIIGAGNLGQAIAQGLLKNPDFRAEQLALTRRNTASLKEFEDKGVRVMQDNIRAIHDADLIILGVKPYNVKHILTELAPTIRREEQILVSLATGITLQEMEEALGFSMTTFRAMPNIAADIQESITCICHSGATTDQEKEIQELFDHIGQSISIDEGLMEAATVLGACGIAYVLRFMRAMIQGGIQIGFDSHTASQIVNQTVKGAAELMIKSKLHPEAAIDKVTTPKGCTIVGLNEMEHHGFSSSMVRGVLASFQKIEK